MINIALVSITISILLVIYRVLRGPTWGDRIMAFDFLASNIVILILLLAIRAHSATLLDTALVLALLGFLGTIALTRFLLFGRVMR